MKKYNRAEGSRDLKALARKFKCVIYEDTLDIYTTVIAKNKSQHEAVKATKKEKTGWLVFMPEGVKFYDNKQIVVAPYKGSYSDLQKEGHHKPEYVPPLNEDQDFDPRYSPDREYPTPTRYDW
ncbi:MAG: hypothetical protein E7019_03730 [Alphaproteobacteria bacterium]|nr:hypothetical protein [Alphaproteobacteria bacterium]